jgi:hypothetical protein
MVSAVRRAAYTELPTEPERRPEPDADGSSGGNQRDDAGREIRVHHQQQATGQLRPSCLFLPIHEEHKADPARNQRQD